MPNFVFSAGRTTAMSDVWSLYVAGHCRVRVLVHVVSLRSDMVWRVAILRVAVGAVHLRVFGVGVHRHHVKVLIAV